MVVKQMDAATWWHGSPSEVSLPWWPLTHGGTFDAARRRVSNKVGANTVARNGIEVSDHYPEASHLSVGDPFPMYALDLEPCSALVFGRDHLTPTPDALIVEVAQQAGLSGDDALVAAMYAKHGAVPGAWSTERGAAAKIVVDLAIAVGLASGPFCVIWYPNQVEVDGGAATGSVIILDPSVVLATALTESTVLDRSWP